MSKLVRPLVCAQCAAAKVQWTEHCPHAMELWKDGFSTAVQERVHPRLTSEDVRRAIGDFSPSWKNFYHLAADSLNRILDEKEKMK